MSDNIFDVGTWIKSEEIKNINYNITHYTYSSNNFGQASINTQFKGHKQCNKIGKLTIFMYCSTLTKYKLLQKISKILIQFIHRLRMIIAEHHKEYSTLQMKKKHNKNSLPNRDSISDAHNISHQIGNLCILHINKLMCVTQK